MNVGDILYVVASSVATVAFIAFLGGAAFVLLSSIYDEFKRWRRTRRDE